MRFTAHKAFFAWDFEEEEKWINEMAAKGMNLQGVGFCKYVFEEGTPGEYQYHLEWLKNRPNHPESVSYIRFLEETGAEHVGSFKNWIYLRKKRADGAFDLFSDLDSRIDHFKRIARLIYVILAIIALYLAYSVWICISRPAALSSFIPIYIVYAVILIGTVFGLIKTRRTYNRLKKERIMRE
jgi:hypothetical protein